MEAISNPSVLEISDGVSEETIMLRKLLNSTIDEMELSVRSFNCLQAAGIKYIYELVNKEENQMLKYKNFGRKSITPSHTPYCIPQFPDFYNISQFPDIPTTPSTVKNGL